MQIIEKPIDEIIPYANNPRNNDEAVDKVAASIAEFGFKVPVIVDKNNIIVAGHTRVRAAKKLGLNTVPCIMADDLTDAQVKAFRLADNKVGELATWDMEKLELELEDLEELDMTEFGFEDMQESKPESVEREEHEKLIDNFIVPPFSVLDARQGYWNDRKRAWLEKGIASGEGRDDALVFTNTTTDYMQKIKTGTSVFDPVLTEVMYKWFCPEGGHIFDCFAGGSVRGIVAEMLGYKYTGIDLRSEQIEENEKQAQACKVKPTWICDDSLNADDHIKDESADMVFTCPPYADLEVYSDDPRDISNMNYDDFKRVYGQILQIACRKLKNNRFAVVVVGDVRDKKGYYRLFVDYTRECLRSSGLNLYNELILVEPVGTAAIRAPKSFSSARKVVKTHQNVLVFYKGDEKAIKDNFKEIEVDFEEGI